MQLFGGNDWWAKAKTDLVSTLRFFSWHQVDPKLGLMKPGQTKPMEDISDATQINGEAKKKKRMNSQEMKNQ